jgi:hypothetical protein
MSSGMLGDHIPAILTAQLSHFFSGLRIEVVSPKSLHWITSCPEKNRDLSRYVQKNVFWDIIR